MQVSDYALEANFLTWDSNALQAFLDSFDAQSWKDVDRTMPYILFQELDSSVIDILTQFNGQLQFDLSASYFIKLKANSVLPKHIDSRNASLNIPLTPEYTSSFVTFYEDQVEIVDGFAKVTPVEHVYNSKDMPVFYKTTLQHSFHNPTNKSIILLNLSLSSSWDDIKKYVESKTA